MKLISAYCKICKKLVTIQVADDLAKNRETYPFEYIDIHGTPEHVLMMFLDQNLSVRDAIAYKDLNFVKQKSTAFQELMRLSEIDIYASIYQNPLRLQLFLALTEGPKTEDQLIAILKQNPEFKTDEFDTLIIPFLRSGLLKTKWLQATFEMGYFLIQDFMVIRIEPKKTFRIFLEDPNFKPVNPIYFQQVADVFSNYQKRFSSGREAQTEEIRLCLELRSNFRYFNLLNELMDGPKTFEELINNGNKELIDYLIEKEFIMEIKTKTEKYYALLSELKIKKFTPKYLTSLIAQKLMEKEIDKEMALSHLDFLSNSEINTLTF